MLDTLEELEAAAAFKAAVIQADVTAFWDALELVECHWAWGQAFRAISHVSAPQPIRLSFLEACAARGDSLRSCVNNDQLLVRALRNLLPQYEVPKGLSSLVLYRGARREERRYRRYGHSWTDDISVARSHAANGHQGSHAVVFKADVPVEAVISATWQFSDSFHEREFVIDRRLLGRVLVHEEVAGPFRPERQMPIFSDETVHVGRFTTLKTA